MKHPKRRPAHYDVVVDESVLTSAFAGMTFPAPRWQLLAWAEHNGAGPALLAALYRAPERDYYDLDGVARSLRAAVPDRASTPASRLVERVDP